MNWDKEPRIAIITRIVINYDYKYDEKGQINDRKARFTYPGNRLAAGMHYDPEQVAPYTADRNRVRLMISLSTQIKELICHIEF